MAEKEAYFQAARTGMYEKPKGLLGKYDNVRRFWEDQVTARLLAPSFGDLVAARTAMEKGVRILDLGCGGGDGLELMLSIPRDANDWSADSTRLLNSEVIDEYIGLDINEDLLCQAEACHGKGEGVRFIQGDLSDGLPENVKSLNSFDIYFAGYGTLSHFHDDQTARIIADIARHSADGALFVGDWLGRYSYEWQDLWPNPLDEEYFMDYRISYIYPEEERDHVDISSFALRLMTRDEILSIVAAASSFSGAEIVPLSFFDRSIFVGRHMDTGDYNRQAVKLRQAVNSLFEYGRRTDLDSLMVEYAPHDDFSELNSFFNSFFRATNSLVDYTKSLLASSHGGDPTVPSLGLPRDCSDALEEAQRSMDRFSESIRNVHWCDVRANFIEPMLGYCLRKLEMQLQPGSGMGHGLVGVFEIRK
jgi:SAM-dependent methyltransferase